MTSRTHLQAEPNWNPWLPVIVHLGALALVLAVQFEALDLEWWSMIAFTVVAAVVAWVSTLFQENNRMPSAWGWARILGFRMITIGSAGAWAVWTTITGWNLWLGIWLGGGTLALGTVGAFITTPPRRDPRKDPEVTHQAMERSRHPIIVEWEHRIRTISKIAVVVTHWEPWAVKSDGLRLFVELPADQGTTAADLAAFCDKFASSARLPRGCAVRVLDSDRQGVVVVDVMLRNTLVETAQVHKEPTEPASINDDFPILGTPRGEILSVCLRIYSMVVGGTTGSGKTTLLHRLIMWLARCVDALIWVVDLNGGGLAEPWINPWANGRTSKPVVDWVADSEEEAALMVAVAAAIARDRKTNREAVRRKRAANEMVLPVDKDMPAIVILTDEGGEVRQAASLFGQLAAAGITRLVQIGRAEGVRGILSVLRGTADLTDKAFRVNAALRLCLRMEEHDEYTHILGSSPGKTELSGALGAGYLRTPTIPRPVLGRTVNVDLRGIDEHAVACGPLRPSLDKWGLKVAARVTASDVIGGRTPAEEHMECIQMQHADEGMAYTGRWQRYAPKLAEMRGDLDDDLGDSDDDGFNYEDVPVPVPAAVRQQSPAAPVRVPAGSTSALDKLDAEYNKAKAARPAVASQAGPAVPASGARVYQMPATGQGDTSDDGVAREQILAFINEHGPVAASVIERNIARARSRVYVLLGQMVSEGMIAKDGKGLYVMGDVGVADVVRIPSSYTPDSEDQEWGEELTTVGGEPQFSSHATSYDQTG